jgi:hypothetical protein
VAASLRDADGEYGRPFDNASPFLKSDQHIHASLGETRPHVTTSLRLPKPETRMI